MALGIASATDRHEESPEGRAYLGFAFGGERAMPRTFHYGLRLDHDARFVEGPVAPLMQFDFTRRGLYDARLNGLSVLKAEYRLRQAEETPPEESEPTETQGEAPAEAPPEAAAEAAPAEAAPAETAEVPAEEGGFFSGIGHFFSNLFGGDEDVAEAAPAEAAPADTETAEAEEAPAEATEGGFMSYSAIDWGLLALGAVGVGMAVSETIGGEESPDTAATSTTGSSTTGGSTTGIPTTGVPTTGGVVPLGLASGLTVTYSELSEESRERLEWLDGGTGHMGDLEPQH